MGIFTKTSLSYLSSRIAVVALAAAMLALMTAAVGCGADEPTAIPPTATAVMPSPTSTQEPAATAEPTATPTPEPTSTPTPVPSPTATPEPALPTVREIIDAAAAAMASVESGSITLEGSAALGGDVSLETTLVLSGDFQAPDRSRFTTSISAAGVSLEYDSIVIGEDGYQENLFTGDWEASQDARSILGDSGYLGQLDLALIDEDIALITLEGVVDLDGVRVYHLKGDLPGSAAANITGDSTINEDAQGEPLEAEMWIGVEDSLVRKMSLGFQLTDDLSGQTINALTILTYSDFGKDVDIQAPEVAQPVFSITLPGGFDDHGNDQWSATEIAIGETAEGIVDDLFDFDYFVFRAEEGQTYVMVVSLGTLTDSTLGLYDSNGEELDWNDDYGDSAGSRIEWTAPATGEYFLAVEGFDVDATGTYTLTVTEAGS